MPRTKRGEPVLEIRTTNPAALAIVNARALREQIDASTAAALCILESQNQRGNSNRRNTGGQAKKPASFRDGMTTK
jgi:hypothetical protein